MPLSGDTLLELADQVSVVRTGASIKVALGRVTLRGGRYTLSILDVFSTQKSLSQGLKELELRTKSASGWVEVVAQVKELYEIGVLLEPGGAQVLRRAHEIRFDSAPVHITMLNDERRTVAFQSAIRRAVTPGDVVLDIGCGTGVLAVTAALAGARHVYAVEATPMSRVAQRLVDANGVGDRVTVIEAHSFDIELPERADLLVSETIGDDPLGERILSTFEDARQRLLATGARAIPSRLEVLALPLDVPEGTLQSCRFTVGRTAEWTDRYGLDFNALVPMSETQDHLVHINSYRTRSWDRLADPIVVGDFDLLQSSSGVVEQQVSFCATATGTLSGALLFFRADLGSDVHLSLHPDDATPSNSWGNLLYLFGEPMHVAQDQEIGLSYSYADGASRIQLIGE